MKITILTQGIRNTDALNKGIEDVKNALATIVFPVEITIKPTTKVFTTGGYKNPTIGQGYAVDGNQILSEVDGTEDVAFLIFSNKGMNPTPLNPCHTGIKKGKCTPCQMCEEWYNDFDMVFEEYFLHELCHALYFLNNKVTQDMTHLMTNMQMNPTLYMQYVKGNISNYYLSIIKQFMPPTLPVITLTRKPYDTKQTMGDLTGNGFMCKTLERSAIGAVKCIPTGTYTVKWAFMPSHLTWHYELQNVPGFTGIFIHAGNYFFDSLGCILLGDSYSDINGDRELDVLNTRVVVSKFETLMNKLPFTLIVK